MRDMSLERQYRELKDLQEKVRQREGKNWSRRSLERQSVWREVLLSIPGHITSEPCLVRDLSSRGAGIQLNGLTLLPTEFSLSFDGFRTTSPCRLTWRQGDFIGVAFQNTDRYSALVKPNTKPVLR
ncbi:MULTISPECIES: PilZ domain-containing protein [Bradyrhizobium]